MEKSCAECPEPMLAHSLCTLCNKWLCYQCTDTHQHSRAPSVSQYAESQPKPNTGHCPDPSHRGPDSLPSMEPGPGSYPRSPLTCHSHRQEPLELFCESCDLLCCTSCHLSAHKTHRLVHIGKALQDQEWLFESFMAQVEERRSTVENTAKQIENRLHGVKIMQRKTENQIKMAKMIMTNELNKRANLLIEQLEAISKDFQRHLEDQLQGAIEICGQLDHAQKFITWATTQHRRSPVLFSRELISLQMQQLPERSLHSDSWIPLKIKFNWDASYWTKQISSLGQLAVEGGTCAFAEGSACPSVLRPQPVPCLLPPSVCRRGREQACGYPSCCQPRCQMCCLHGPPAQDKSQLDAVSYPAGRAAPSFALHQLTQRCWERPRSHPPSPSSPPGAAESHRTEQPPGNHADPQGEPRWTARARDVGRRVGKLWTGESPPHRRPAGDRGAGTDGIAGLGHVGSVHSGGRQETQQQLLGPAEEQRVTRPPLPPKDVRRSTSLEMCTAVEFGGETAGGRLGSGSACGRRKSRSQSIPAELAAPPSSEQPTERAHSLDTRAVDQYASSDPRHRRASDGVVQCVTKETSSAVKRLSPLLSYKTEPENVYGYANEDKEYKAEETQRSQNREPQKDTGNPKVPVVCLERLKILVSRLPPHGRRQSDPLPASGLEESEDPPQHRPCVDVMTERTACGSGISRTTLSLSTPPYTEGQGLSPAATDIRDLRKSSKEPSTPAASVDAKYAPQPCSALELDSDSDLRSVSELELVSDTEPDSEPSEESDPRCGSSWEGEHGPAAGQGSAGGTEPPSESDASAESEPSGEYEAHPESYSGVSLGNGEDPDPDVDSPDAEAESDTQQDSDPGIQADSDSDILSDPPPQSPGSAQLEPENLESDAPTEFPTDDPLPLRSDQEEESPSTTGPSQRALLLANPSEGPLRDQDSVEMESEDFCAVCLIGGELLCCDRCPKVFHLACHVPPLLSFPTGDWLCTLCRDDTQSETTSGEHVSTQGLSACDQAKCEQLTLMIFSNILSAPFHEPVSPLARHYYQIIKKPMDLSVIKAKLNKMNPLHYFSPEEFVADVHLMFRNCAKFNYPDSEVAQAGRSLQTFFNSKLKDVFPEQGFPMAEEESDSDEYDEAYQACEGGFPWPERREQCHRKRKRRHSVNSRKHQ